MLVNAWKNIDVEVEVDVQIEDCLNEMLDRANSEDGPRRKMEALNGALKVLAAISPDIIPQNNQEKTKEYVGQHLSKWIEWLIVDPLARRDGRGGMEVPQC